MESLQIQNFVTNDELTTLVFPILIGVLILIIGIIVAKIIRKVIKSILKKAGIEKKIADSPAGSALGDYSLVNFFVNIVYVYLILIVLQQAVSFIKLDIFSYYVGEIAKIFPVFVYGVILIVVGFVIGEYAKYYIKRTSLLFAGLFATISKLLIVFFFLVMALPHFMVDPTIFIDTFRIFLMAFAIAFALGFGLAIGLGSKDMVAEVMKSKKEEIMNLVGVVEGKIKSKK